MRTWQLMLILLCSSSCIVDANLPIPETTQEVILNGLLHPDSVTSVTLSWSRALDDPSPFKVIDNASVEVYDNGVLMGDLDHTGNGRYAIDQKPTAGHSYRVVANIPGYGQVEAEDALPGPPDYSACFRRTTEGNIAISDVTVEIDINESGSAHQWIDLVSHDYHFVAGKRDTSILYIEKFFYINTNSPLLDDFNATFDQEFGSNQYTFYLRVQDDLTHPEIEITVGATRQSSPLFRYDVLSQPFKDQSLIVIVYSCSPTYDQYLKATMLHAELFTDRFAQVSTRCC